MQGKELVEYLRQPATWNPLTSWGEMEYTGWMEKMFRGRPCCLGDWSFGRYKGVLVEGRMH